MSRKFRTNVCRPGIIYLMYKDSKAQSVNFLRSKIIKKVVGKDLTLTSNSIIDLAKLLPCFSIVLPHIYRESSPCLFLNS